MKPRQYFPLGKAYGKAFCNRTKEAEVLLGNVENSKHTFLLAPRRYGKSSLCERVFEKTNLTWTKLDFHLAVSEKDVERIIINGVIELIGKSVDSVEKLSAILKKYTKRLKPKLGIGPKSFRLELEITDDGRPAENIAEALSLLEKLLNEKNKQAILLFDEFQEITKMEKGRAIEGAIRHVGQETSMLSFIFSGSCPNILKGMFEDERRPLYKLCRKLVLGRIDDEHYLKHLNNAAKAMWGKRLETSVFRRIMFLTERHPYYVNYLCDILWSENASLPNIKQVDECWHAVAEEERSDLLRDFFRLTENQRKLLIYIAKGNSKNIQSHESAKKMDMVAASIARGLNSLTEQDYIEKAAEGYRLIVPLYSEVLGSH